MLFSPSVMSSTPSSQPFNSQSTAGLGFVAVHFELLRVPLITLPTPMEVTKSPRVREVSNLYGASDGFVEVGGLLAQLNLLRTTVVIVFPHLLVV